MTTKMAGTMEHPEKGNLTDPRAIYAKGGLFLILGFLAGDLLLAEHFAWKSVVLLAVCVWAFCRAYYFAFYVIEHYVDSSYRFSGLIDFCKYCVSRGAEKTISGREETHEGDGADRKNAVDR